MLQEINGVHLTGDKAGQPLSSYTEMKTDGSTTGGCWIYTGVYADGVNQAARRKPGPRAVLGGPGVGLGVADEPPHALQPRLGRPRGQAVERAQGLRVVGRGAAAAGPATTSRTSRWTSRPSYRPEEGVGGPEGLAGDDPFIMQADGKGWLYAPTGLLDGPLPAHYEPHESPVRNPFYRQQANPTRQVFRRTDNLLQPLAPRAGAEVFPYVFTTYRLTEHHTAGGMSRWLPYLSELQPEFFCEVSPELAARAGAGARRLGDDRHAPGPRSRPGCWSPTGSSRCTVGGRIDPPGRPALPLGRRRHRPW